MSSQEKTDLPQAVEGADEQFVLQYASECQIVEHDADEWECCRDAGRVGGSIAVGLINDESQQGVVSHEQYHAQGEDAHLEGAACEKEDVEECESGDNHQQGKQSPGCEYMFSAVTHSQPQIEQL